LGVPAKAQNAPGILHVGGEPTIEMKPIRYQKKKKAGGGEGREKKALFKGGQRSRRGVRVEWEELWKHKGPLKGWSEPHEKGRGWGEKSKMKEMNKLQKKRP